MNKHLVFVYGTLRQGGVRAMPQLFPRAKFIAQAKVSGSLYDLGEYPCLLLDESSSLVIGEVYEIDDEILHQLDEIEAASAYWRKRTEVSSGNQSMRCWVYAPDSESYPHRSLITSGDWIEYAKTKTAMS
ncbi:MAG: gamma-glutamylcyclotransferase family protein [Pyrinomonadaceae bacterium]